MKIEGIAQWRQNCAIITGFVTDRCVCHWKRIQIYGGFWAWLESNDVRTKLTELIIDFLSWPSVPINDSKFGFPLSL